MWLVFIRGGRNSSNAVSIVLVAVCLLQRSSVSFTRPNISQAFGVSSSSWDFAKRTRLESLLSNHCLLRGRLWYVDSSGGSFGWPSRLPSPYHRQSSGKLTFFWCFLECFSCRRLWWRMHCVRTTEKNHSWFLIWRILILTDWFALPNLIVDLSWPRYMPGLGTAKLSETSFAVLSAMSFLACSHHPSFPTNTWPWSFRVQLPGYWRVSLALYKAGAESHQLVIFFVSYTAYCICWVGSCCSGVFFLSDKTSHSGGSRFIDLAKTLGVAAGINAWALLGLAWLLVAWRSGNTLAIVCYVAFSALIPLVPGLIICQRRASNRRWRKRNLIWSTEKGRCG